MQNEERFPIPKGYIFFRHLGCGPMGYSAVVRSLKGDFFVCKEVLKERIGNADRVQRFKERLDHIKTLSSPFLVPYTSIFEDETRLFLIRQYFEQGSLSECCRSLTELGTNKVFAMWCVLARTFFFLHQHHIAPNFIRSNNLFLFNGTCIVVTDLYPAPSDVNHMVHSPNPIDIAFLAPEFFSQKTTPDYTADIWSLGIVLAFLISGELPFNTKNLFTMMAQISNATLTYAKPVPEELDKIIRGFVCVDPTKRVQLSAVVKMNTKQSGSRRLSHVSSTTSTPTVEFDSKQIEPNLKQRSSAIVPTKPLKSSLNLKFSKENASGAKHLSIASYMVLGCASTDQVMSMSKGDVPQLRCRPMGNIRTTVSCGIKSDEVSQP